MSFQNELVYAPYAMAHALLTVSNTVRAENRWVGSNEQAQVYFNIEYPRICGVLQRHQVPGLESFASKSATELNLTFEERKFDLRFREFATGEWGVASFLKVLFDWKVKGTEVSVHAGQHEYPGFLLKVGNRQEPNFQVWTHPGVAEPVVILRTQNDGDVVLMDAACADRYVGTPSVGATCQGIQELLLSMERDDSHNGVHVPMVDLNVRPDVSHLVGSYIETPDGGKEYISQAMEQIKFQMDHIGVVVDTAAGVAVAKGASRENNYVFNKPFYVIAGLNTIGPIFCGKIETEFWKKPVRS